MALRATVRPFGPPRADPTRSIPVTAFDRDSALAELAYASAADRKRLARVIAAGADPALAAELSDALWTRYGATNLSYAYLALLDETCRDTPAWPGLEQRSGVAGVLALEHAPCRSVSPSVSRPPTITSRTCVVAAPADLVVPADLDSNAMLGWRPAGRITSSSSDHGSLDGVSACLSRLRVTR